MALLCSPDKATAESLQVQCFNAAKASRAAPALQNLPLYFCLEGPLQMEDTHLVSAAHPWAPHAPLQCCVRMALACPLEGCKTS